MCRLTGPLSVIAAVLTRFRQSKIRRASSFPGEDDFVKRLKGSGAFPTANKILVVGGIRSGCVISSGVNGTYGRREMIF